MNVKILEVKEHEGSNGIEVKLEVDGELRGRCFAGMGWLDIEENGKAKFENRIAETTAVLEAGKVQPDVPKKIKIHTKFKNKEVVL